ncbi:g4379 [Coccomyxa elongata]
MWQGREWPSSRAFVFSSDAEDDDAGEAEEADEVFLDAVDEDLDTGFQEDGLLADEEEEDIIPPLRTRAVVSSTDGLDIVADEEDEDDRPRSTMKASAGIVLDDDVDEDDEDELLADVDTEAGVPILDEGLDLDAIIDSGTPAMPSNMGGQEEFLGIDEDEVELEGEEDIEELPGPSYPEPPIREYALGDLLEMAGYGLVDRAASNTKVSGLHTDPHKILPGDLYISLEQDTEENVSEAIENGAVAILGPQSLGKNSSVPMVKVPNPRDAMHRMAAAFYNDPSQKMSVVGVTGSSGKTTTSWLIRGIFEEWGKLTGMMGSIENALYADKLDAEGNLWVPDEADPTLDRDCSAAFHLTPYKGKYEAPNEAPDGLEAQKLLAGMADRGAEVAVVECNPDGLEQGRMDHVDLNIAVFTNLATDAAEEGEFEELLEAQGAIFRRLTNPTTQRAIINLDDPYADDIRAFAAQVPVVTYAMYNKSADVWPEKLRFSMWETEIKVQTPVGPLLIITPLIGRHNVYNILAAVAVGLAVTVDGEPIPLKTIVQGIEATEIVPGRCEVIDEDQPFGCVVDAADTPAALSRLMDGLRECCNKRLILVLGCPGEQDQGKRPFMGEIAHYKADLVIMTNDSPRGEGPNEIIADMVAGYPDSILKRNASVPYQPGFLQDPGRVDYNALEFLWHNCYEYRRYVVEDRWTAIRWAIGSAQADDCVVIAGRGHKDFVEWTFDGETVRGWFDDRVEARNALAKVAKLWQISGFDHAELPWMDVGDREGRMFNKALV